MYKKALIVDNVIAMIVWYHKHQAAVPVDKAAVVPVESRKNGHNRAGGSTSNTIMATAVVVKSKTIYYQTSTKNSCCAQ